MDGAAAAYMDVFTAVPKGPNESGTGTCDELDRSGRAFGREAPAQPLQVAEIGHKCGGSGCRVGAN